MARVSRSGENWGILSAVLILLGSMFWCFWNGVDILNPKYIAWFIVAWLIFTFGLRLFLILAQVLLGKRKRRVSQVV